MAFYSSGVEYGIHSLMYMTDTKGENNIMSVRDMAELQNIPYDFLAKIFTRLSRAKLVIGTEGKKGGFTLARSPELITVLDVVKAIDGERKLLDCKEIRQNFLLFNNSAPEWVCNAPCGVMSVFNSAQERMEDELSRHTILDLVRQMFRKSPEAFYVEVQDWIANR